MLHVIATIELQPGQREKVLDEFRKIVPLVRAEKGCLAYGPTVDLATDISAQAPLQKDVVVVVEQWEDLDSLEAHLAAPHMTEYRPRVKPLIARAQLQVLAPA
jgi:quinol monooxygenase YgiN